MVIISKNYTINKCSTMKISLTAISSIAAKPPPFTGSLPSREYITSVTELETAAANFLIQKHIFKVVICPMCGSSTNCEQELNATDASFYKVHCCKKSQHDDGKVWKSSIQAGTLFSGMQFSKMKLINLVYMYLQDMKHKDIMMETCLASQMVTDWCNFLDETIMLHVANQENFVISRQGIEVHIDESKFGKRKYNVSVRM